MLQPCKTRSVPPGTVI